MTSEVHLNHRHRTRHRGKHTQEPFAPEPPSAYQPHPRSTRQTRIRPVGPCTLIGETRTRHGSPQGSPPTTATHPRVRAPEISSACGLRRCPGPEDCAPVRSGWRGAGRGLPLGDSSVDDFRGSPPREGGHTETRRPQLLRRGRRRQMRSTPGWVTTGVRDEVTTGPRDHADTGAQWHWDTGTWDTGRVVTGVQHCGVTQSRDHRRQATSGARECGTAGLQRNASTGVRGYGVT